MEQAKESPPTGIKDIIEIGRKKQEITRIAVDKSEQRVDEFEAELKETKTPSPEMETYPARLIL